MDVLKAPWNDSVWSKVIAGGIIAIIGAAWAAIKYKWWDRITARWSIKLTMTNRAIGYQAGAGYPLNSCCPN